MAESFGGLSNRILVIDDEVLICRMLNRLLKVGYEVVTATTGSEAKNYLEERPDFGVILCDLMMPEISGMELFEWIEQEHPELAPRVVFMTGGTFTPRARSFLEEVPNLVINKPFDPGELRELIAERMVQASRLTAS